MTTTYSPRPGSLPHRVCAWFQSHDDDELSAADISIKFDTPRGSVINQLQQCVVANLLNYSSSTRGAGGGNYTAGPRLAAWGGAGKSAAGEPSSNGASSVFDVARRSTGAPASKSKRLPPPPLDLSSIEIERGLPVPPKGTAAKPSLSGALLTLLTEPDTSVALPIEYYPSLCRLAPRWQREGKGNFEVRKISETRLRLYRTA